MNNGHANDTGRTWPPATLLTKLTDDEIRARMTQLYGHGRHLDTSNPAVDFAGIAKARTDRSA